MPLLEPLFHELALELVVPPSGAFPAPPRGGAAARKWWEDICSAPTRDTAFLDEKLSYAVALHLPESALPSTTPDSPPAELALLSRQLQITATASFLPPHHSNLPPSPTKGLGASGTPVNRRASYFPETSPGRPGPVGNGGPPPPQVHITQAPGGSPHQGHGNAGPHADGAPLHTPNPFPAMTPGAEAFAGVEGVTVWEGAVETPDADGAVLVKTDEGWTAVWRGELPVVYVRTSIQNPVLALTAFVTLREGGRRRSATVGVTDAASIVSTSTLITDSTDPEEPTKLDLAAMEEIDLLGGLVSDPMPASRLPPSLRDDLSVRRPQSPSIANSPSFSPGSVRPMPSSSTTLRKSYRRVLSLSPGLRVRMRTLFLPQLLPPNAATDESEDAERRIVLSVEIENGADQHEHGFEIVGVTVDVGGKGSKAVASLICQPGQVLNGDVNTFPLRLSSMEQYNLLYAVDIANTPGAKGDDHRPVSIVLSGRPFRPAPADADLAFPTAAFQSRWNCALDLAPYYASLPPAPPAPPAHAPSARHTMHRLSKPNPPIPNAIAGDKKYSLAALLADKPTPGPERSRLVSRPMMPSSAMNRVVSARAQNIPQAVGDGHGLLVSVKLLPPDLADDVIRPLDTFSVEVFVHNRTDSVRRFRLAIPPRDALDARIRDAWARRRRRRADEPTYGADDPVVSVLLAQHEAAAPALIALETDVRCGPLLPGASLAARVRFLALREGVHRIERMRLTGVGEDFDFVITPVMDIVVEA